MLCAVFACAYACSAISLPTDASSLNHSLACWFRSGSLSASWLTLTFALLSSACRVCLSTHIHASSELELCCVCWDHALLRYLWHQSDTPSTPLTGRVNNMILLQCSALSESLLIQPVFKSWKTIEGKPSFTIMSKMKWKNEKKKKKRIGAKLW